MSWRGTGSDHQLALSAACAPAAHAGTIEPGSRRQDPGLDAGGSMVGFSAGHVSQPRGRETRSGKGFAWVDNLSL